LTSIEGDILSQLQIIALDKYRPQPFFEKLLCLCLIYFHSVNGCQLGNPSSVWEDLEAMRLKSDLDFADTANICDFYVMANFEFKIVYALPVGIKAVMRWEEAPVWLLCFVELKVFQVALGRSAPFPNCMFKGLVAYSISAYTSGIVG
jgi:hypothetical protein